MVIEIFMGLTSFLLSHGKHKGVINWHYIQEINFKRNKIELISSFGKKVEIHLFLVDRRDKEDLVHALRHSPYEVSYFP